MRHLVANLAVYLIAGFIVVSAVFFARVRSNQVVLSREQLVEPPEYLDADDLSLFEWGAFGEAAYVANCQNCHGSEGEGRDVYPPLVGQAVVFNAPGGREYLTRIVLYGLASGLHSAPMPPMDNLSDAQVAAINNYMLTHFGNRELLRGLDSLYVPTDVARERERALSPNQVGAQRPAVPPPRALARPHARER